MLEIIFAVCMLWIFGKIFAFGIRAAWGISKIVLTVVFLPIVLVGMVIAGLIYIAFPILLIVGIFGVFRSRK